MDELKKEMLKQLPKIDEILLILEKRNIDDLAPRNIVKEICRKVVQDTRDKIVNPKKRFLWNGSLMLSLLQKKSRNPSGTYTATACAV